MDDEAKPRKPRPAGASRRRIVRRREKREIAHRFLPIGHPSVRIMPTAIVAELHTIGRELEQISAAMDRGDIPAVPEARGTQEMNRSLIEGMLHALDGGSH